MKRIRLLLVLLAAWMQQFIDKYALVYANLIKHDQAYPTPEYLKSLVNDVDMLLRHYAPATCALCP